VVGSNYDDTLFGNEQNNLLDGGAGSDTLTGGSGNDGFVFNEADVNAIDVISDFNCLEDFLDFNLSGGQTSENINDWLNLSDDGTDIMLAIDLNGDSVFEDFVQLDNVTGITLEDMNILV